ncbi:unnamed protein product [Caenorhabditis bovis]|uniref:Molybdopterin synthase catalytic subunit n=1 Tax=Caenorhabditis bovis TaxID=2654633 RepID=A0A8S1F8A8_9PELO|nr:unnamed protein product [Caenorhabditis bovis]
MLGNVLAIAGCTNSGKTSLALRIAKIVEKIYMKINGVDVTERGFYYSYDEKESVDIERFKEAIENASKQSSYVIVEGNMITEMEQIVELCTRIIVLTLDIDTCHRRRLTRVYDPPDDVGYFEYVAWPAYQRHLRRAFEKSRIDKRLSFLDVSSPSDVITEESMLQILSQVINDHVKISVNPLDVNEIMQMASSPSCGAVSLFVGTTRDVFEGKQVKTLSYDCYDEMAYKELRKICAQLHEIYDDVEKVAIHHRIGDVPIKESSIVIAVSSPHRNQAMEASKYAIEEIKNSVPIWKKEIYESGEHVWKNNSHCGCNKQLHSKTSNSPLVKSTIDSFLKFFSQ